VLARREREIRSFPSFVTRDIFAFLIKNRLPFQVVDSTSADCRCCRVNANFRCVHVGAPVVVFPHVTQEAVWVVRCRVDEDAQCE
jgi:hypothetical protein